MLFPPLDGKVSCKGEILCTTAGAILFVHIAFLEEQTTQRIFIAEMHDRYKFTHTYIQLQL